MDVTFTSLTVNVGYQSKSSASSSSFSFSQLKSKCLSSTSSGGGMGRPANLPASTSSNAVGKIATPPPRSILKNISGRLTPGRITALMGSSGSGKTSLMRALARRFEPTLRYEGTVRYDGGKFYPKLKRQIAFVPQDDVYPAKLTVRQHLEISSKLRLDLPDSERLERMNEVVHKLRLEKCIDTPIEGVSGGERKRTCIAVELLTKPRLLLLDEPTSGLDSTLANVMVDVMVDLAKEGGITVCTTIHQPSSLLFSKMQDLIALCDGELFYRGEASLLVSWFASCGRVCPVNYNPADFLLDTLVLDVDNVKKDEKIIQAIRALPPIVHHHSQGSMASISTTGVQSKLTSAPSVMFDRFRGLGDDKNSSLLETQYALSIPKQIYWLVHRMMIRYSKEIFTRQVIICQCGLALVSALLWFNLPLTSSTVFLRGTVAFWIVGTDMYLSLFSSVFALHDEVALLRKDLFDSAYSLVGYFIARSMTIYPQNSIWSIFYVSITLAATQASPSWGNAIVTILIAQLCIIHLQSWGLFISATIDMPSIMTAAIVTVTYWFAFSGLFAPPNTMQPGLGWLRYIDPQTYIWQLQLRQMFPSSARFQCDSKSQIPQCTANKNSSSPDYGYITGDEALDMFQVDIAPWVCVVVLIVGSIVLRFLAYLALSVRIDKWTGNRKQFLFCGKKIGGISEEAGSGGGGVEEFGGQQQQQSQQLQQQQSQQLQQQQPQQLQQQQPQQNGDGDGVLATV
jgi:ABC-type multidrug transport system ATPase subunit